MSCNLKTGSQSSLSNRVPRRLVTHLEHRSRIVEIVVTCFMSNHLHICKANLFCPISSLLLVTTLWYLEVVGFRGLCNGFFEHPSHQSSSQAGHAWNARFGKILFYVFRSHSLTKWGEEAGISIELQVGAINLTAAILVVFPVNLKQMRVILAIIWRGEETTDIMLIVSPHRLLNAVALIPLWRT